MRLPHSQSPLSKPHHHQGGLQAAGLGVMDPFVHATALRYYSHSRRIGVTSSILFPVPGRVSSGTIPTGVHSYSLLTVRRYVPARKGELFRICPANLVNHPFYVIQNGCHTSIIKALIILHSTLRPLFI